MRIRPAALTRGLTSFSALGQARAAGRQDATAATNFKAASQRPARRFLRNPPGVFRPESSFLRYRPSAYLSAIALKGPLGGRASPSGRTSKTPAPASGAAVIVLPGPGRHARGGHIRFTPASAPLSFVALSPFGYMSARKSDGTAEHVSTASTASLPREQTVCSSSLAREGMAGSL